MKTTITFNHFVDGFSNRKDNFSYDGLRAMFDYFEEYEGSCDEEIEFDPIAICCEYTEYKDFKEFEGVYGEKYEDLETLRDYTQVIEIDGKDSFIIQDF